MRGFSKAAAFLSSVYVSASIVPRSRVAEPAGLPDHVIQYDESGASVVFQVSDPIAPGVVIPPLEFQVGSTQEPCGKSNITLGGQILPPTWNGGYSTGSDYLDAFRFLPNIFTTWNISCLDDTSSSAGDTRDGRDPVQVAQFGIYNHNEDRTEAAGFAISFRSSGTPQILRLVPVRIEYSDIEANSDAWRISSIAAEPQSVESDGSSKVHDVQRDQDASGTMQKSLQFHLGHLQEFLGTTYHKARQTFQDWCPTRKQLQGTLGKSETELPSAVQKPTPTTPTIEDTHRHSLPTRSASPQPASAITSPLSSDYTGVKIFGLVLVLSSLVIWIFLRLRDPRLQADRAARREERRNKRLYRQAARQHKWKRWFCNWRHRNHRCTPVSTWDEKCARIAEQEQVLEEAMKEDLEKLGDQHRIESSISAAEQGRSIYVYDINDSRRRSRETLPGYESEGTQPPSYDTDIDGEVGRVADGFRYIPADHEDTPDSSVISTSPRTSRDDQDSDFGKDFEPLTLGATVVQV
ncbi:MAG: hypothetical protein L6R40_003272 [Gallowayella cf. fulva]|nr:MAG: hypothetical protein L6R40_003272 [Xanthomendoza cf. fulva]